MVMVRLSDPIMDMQTFVYTQDFFLMTEMRPSFGKFANYPETSVTFVAG